MSRIQLPASVRINREVIDIASSYGIKLSKIARYNYNLDKLIKKLAERENV